MSLLSTLSLKGFPPTNTLALFSGWKPTNLTAVFTLQTTVFLASWNYAEGIDTDVKYGCSLILDGLVSSHAAYSASLSATKQKNVFLAPTPDRRS